MWSAQQRGSITLYANHHWEVWKQVGEADFEVVVAVGRKRLIRVTKLVGNATSGSCDSIPKFL